MKIYVYIKQKQSTHFWAYMQRTSYPIKLACLVGMDFGFLVITLPCMVSGHEEVGVVLLGDVTSGLGRNTQTVWIVPECASFIIKQIL